MLFFSLSPSPSVPKNQVETLTQLKECNDQLAALVTLGGAGEDDAALTETRKNLTEAKAALEAQVLADEAALDESRKKNAAFIKAVGTAFSKGYSFTDKCFLGAARQKNNRSGSTAVSALIIGT